MRQLQKNRNTHRVDRSKFELSKTTSLLAAMLASSHIRWVRSQSSALAVQVFDVVLQRLVDVLGGETVDDWRGWGTTRMRRVSRTTCWRECCNVGRVGDGSGAYVLSRTIIKISCV